MITIAVNLTMIAFIALPLCAIALGVTVYFFLKTRESLEKTLKATQRPSVLRSMQEKEERQKRVHFMAGLEEKITQVRNKVSAARETPAAAKPASNSDANLVQNLKTTIAQQQKVLNSYLEKIESMEEEGREELKQQNQDLEREIAKLHHVIEKKDEEIDEIYQQASGAQKMASKIEEVYQEFEQLQTKMATLEKQANKANNLAIELEDTRHSYEQVHRELMRKHEKLEEVMNDNQRMRQEMNTLEDKLSEANLQRQQLQKKVQFLQELNTDMQNISDANKKLQTELRRIGELESMLNMMAEERDSLLRKKENK